VLAPSIIRASHINEAVAAGLRAAAMSADPGWHWATRSPKGRGRSPRYRTESLDAIKALPVAKIAADDCALFLWAIGPMLPQALEVIEAWGFTFKTIAFCWAKRTCPDRTWHFGLGYWTRANAELCLLATRDRPKRLDCDVPQLIVGPVQEHSRKPDEALERIERLVPGPYLELFARRARPGWSAVGDQLEDQTT
jgi:N6-adenosine-specific RNA methylase IME4